MADKSKICFTYLLQEVADNINADNLSRYSNNEHCI